MKKNEKKVNSRNQVKISEVDNKPEEPEIDPFLKKKRIQNMILRQIIDHLKEDEESK
jgi:hypothetical protein